MADNVNGKKIKDLPAATTPADTDDFVVDTAAPETKRIRWSAMKSAMRTDFGIDQMQGQLDTIASIYVDDMTLHLPSSVASVSQNTLIINTNTGGT